MSTNSVVPYLKPAAILQRCRQQNQESIYVSFKTFMYLSQILGLLPQKNLSGKVDDLTFSWKCWRVYYTVAVMLMLGVAVACCFIYWADHGSSINALGLGVFYGGTLLTVGLYMQLAKCWPKLLKTWCTVDRIMNIKYGYPRGMDAQIKLWMAVFVTLSLADYLLGIGNNYEQVAASYGRNVTSELVLASSFPQLFAYIPYSIFTTVFCTIITVHANLTWALNDVFIIISSIAIAMRFRQITEKLQQENSQKTMSILFWKGIREDYDRLASFCKELDSHISVLVLLSYFLNIFFLLIQLYHGLESFSSAVRKVYFVSSFFYLIFKTTTVSLYAAWINDESKAPTNILNSLDSSLYNVEIRRLLTQISFDKTALTGCKMFVVKRGIILSVASAIVTYELVLIQFTQANLYDKGQ